MERENRYLVLKRRELINALTKDERKILDQLAEKVSDYRERIGKPPLECVVVEHDWPEYETVWGMIATRVDGG